MIWYRIKKIYDGPEAKKRIKGGAFISSNHVGFSDPFILLTAFLSRRLHFVFMTELIKNKFTAWIYKNVFLSYPIDREKPSLSTMKFLSQYVANGHVLGLFPEGHIKRDGEVDAFKGGIVLMAYLSGKPIIPVYHQKRTSIWRMTRLVIGKPFDVKEKIGPIMNQAKLNEVANELYEYELHLQEMCEAGKK
jgi:1-acyl-sn-glycerol-3-phosphate acyltransferase